MAELSMHKFVARNSLRGACVCIQELQNIKAGAASPSSDSRTIVDSSEGLALIVILFSRSKERSRDMNSYLGTYTSLYASEKPREGPNHIEPGAGAMVKVAQVLNYKI